MANQFDTVTARLNAAADQSEAASGIMHDVSNGGPLDEVATESGPVPSIQKWYADLNDRTSGAVGQADARIDDLYDRLAEVKTTADDAMPADRLATDSVPGGVKTGLVFKLDAEGRLTSETASQAEIVAGVQNTKPVTALGVKQAFDARLGSLAITSSQTISRSIFGNATHVFVEMWSGGGSGAALANSNSNSSGGGEGGEYVPLILRVADLPPSITVVIGSGGTPVVSDGLAVAKQGNPGGSTSFWSFYAPGGLGGMNDRGVCKVNLAGKNGGPGGGDEGVAYGRTVAGPGGDSVFGGGGGGGSKPAFNAGGISQLGGNGGVGKQAAFDGESAGSGVVPGGGGGGIRADNAAWKCNSGAGARGEVRLKWW